jgi:hypothetical protein
MAVSFNSFAKAPCGHPGIGLPTSESAVKSTGPVQVAIGDYLVTGSS